MERSSPRCPCGRAAGNSCCLFSCFLFPFLQCWAWSQPPPAFSRERIPFTSTSYCFSPTMWCLLQPVSAYLTQCCKRNEKSVSHPCSSDGVFSGLRFLSGHVRCAYRLCARRRLPHHLLSRAIGVDRFSAVLHQLHCVGAISGECEAILPARREVDCDCLRDCRIHRAFCSASASATSNRDVSQFGRDHSVDSCGPVFSDWKILSGAES